MPVYGNFGPCPICGKEIPRKDYQTCGGSCAKQFNKRKRQAESNSVSGNTWTISEPATRIHTLDEALEYFQVDTNDWEVERFVCNKWEVGSKGADGGIEVEPLYQIKLWLKRKVADQLARKLADELKQDLLNYRPKTLSITKGRRVSADGCLLEIGPLDHHFGKLAWGLETGSDNYDFDIARDLYRKAVETQLARVTGYGIGRVAFIVGHDILHVNGSALQTFNGTQMDFDSRYARVFRGTRRLLVDIIGSIAKDVAPVDVVVVPGNHDKDSAFHLGDSLECWFHSHPDVTVDNEPKKRKYLEHGSVMLMLTHGEEFTGAAKTQRIPSIMMAEQPEMVGRTRFRECHMGHLHNKETVDLQGTIVRRFSALCATDNWHSQMGFVGSQRSSEALVWSPTDGLVGTAVYSMRTAA